MTRGRSRFSGRLWGDNMQTYNQQAVSMLPTERISWTAVAPPTRAAATGGHSLLAGISQLLPAAHYQGCESIVECEKKMTNSARSEIVRCEQTDQTILRDLPSLLPSPSRCFFCAPTIDSHLYGQLLVAKVVVARYGISCIALHAKNSHSFITPIAADLLRNRTAILRVQR